MHLAVARFPTTVILIHDWVVSWPLRMTSVNVAWTSLKMLCLGDWARYSDGLVAPFMVTAVSGGTLAVASFFGTDFSHRPLLMARLGSRLAPRMARVG